MKSLIILKYLFSIVGVGFSLYSIILCLMRYFRIKELPDDVIGKFNRESYLKTLQKYCMICISANLLSIASFFSPILELKSLVPIIAIIVCSYILQNLIDEIEEFDLSKKDTEILKEFLSKSKAEAREKSKNSKIKKVDSETIQNSEDNSEDN